MFVSEHGGQSEIVLRVKQGDNPIFGFLMPDHHLHVYYRYLVEHPQLLKADKGIKKEKAEYQDSEPLSAPGGALSLLGSVYGSGEDDDGIEQTDNLRNSCPSASVQPPIKVDQPQASASDGLGDKEATKHSASIATSKERNISIKKNVPVCSSLNNGSQRKKTRDGKTSFLDAVEKPQNVVLSNDKASILEPLSFMKRMIDKVVDVVRRNGKESEMVLIEQDKAVGRYPFLLPSNQYHPYYLKTLKDAHEGNVGSRSKIHVKATKKSDNDDPSSDVSERWLYDSQWKEKFKMVIGGRKETQDQYPGPAPWGQPGVSTDEAAAIVLAATRGVSPANMQHASANASISTRKYAEGHNSMTKPVGQLGVSADEAAAIVLTATRGVSPANTRHASASTSVSSRKYEGQKLITKPTHSNDAGSSLHSSSQQLENEYYRTSDDAWIAKAIAKSAALAASSEADSSEASLTKEQKLKAERLKRAKLFASMIKSGVQMSKPAEATSHGTQEVSVHVPVHTNSVSNLAKERERSSVPFASEASESVKHQAEDSRIDLGANHKSGKKHRSRSKGHGHDEDSEGHEDSRKRHRHEHSGSHKHKERHSSSRDKESRHHHKHHSSSEDQYRHRKSSGSRHRRRDGDNSEDESTEMKLYDRHRKRHHFRSDRIEDHERDDAETNLDQTEETLRPSNDHPEAHTVASDNRTNSSAEVPTDLRAKVRAMILETM